MSVVSIPQSVTYIGKYAFSECGSLKSIVVPNSVTSMSDVMFLSSTNLATIKIPYSLKKSVPYTANSVYLSFYGPNNSIYYIVKEGNQTGLQDVNSNWLIPLGEKYYEIAPLIDNYLLVKKNSKCGLITFDNREIVPAELDALEKCGTGFLRFKINGFWGVMNYAGKIIIPTDRGYTKIGDYVSFTKRFPYEMDGYKGECNNLGVQVSKIKVATPKPTNTTTSTSSNSSNSSTSSSKSSSNNNNSNNKTTTVVAVALVQNT